MTISNAITRIDQFKAGSITRKVKQTQQQLVETQREEVKAINRVLGVDQDLLRALADVKRVSAQIDVIIHAAGILYALPHLLEEGEVVQSVSLGADNAHSEFDLVTNRRVAEFKFIQWQAKGNAVREKTLFQDFLKLALEPGDKAKYLYLLNTAIPMRFLAGDRDVLKVLQHERLKEVYHQRLYATHRSVGEYYAAYRDKVRLVNLVEIVPGFDIFMARLKGA